MTVQLLIGSFDITSSVQWQSVAKRDELNQKVDTMTFSMLKYAESTFIPSIGNFATLKRSDGVALFIGQIIRFDKSLEGHGVVRYDFQCVEEGHELTHQLVSETYENKSVNEILAHMVPKYAGGIFTGAVDCPIVIEKIRFVRQSAAECVEKLAELTGYSWYVARQHPNNYPDLHFFEKNKKPAPFSLSDTSENFIFDSLQITDDGTQIRNRVTVKGGEARGASRTEQVSAGAVNSETRKVKLQNKFAQKPAVIRVGSSSHFTVGVDGLDGDGYQVYWNQNERTIRFAQGVSYSGTDQFNVTGIPLFTVAARAEDASSISFYGVREHFIEDASIISIEEGRKRAAAELATYAGQISEGSFETYEDGLRSGQIISIQSDIYDVNESFLIQSVDFRMVTRERGLYRVSLATLKTVSLIDFLIAQVRAGKSINDSSADSTEETYEFYENMDTIPAMTGKFTFEPDVTDAEVRRANRKTHNNVITNVAKSKLIQRLFQQGSPAMFVNWLALGTGMATASAGDTQLASENYRTTVTARNFTPGNLSGSLTIQIPSGAPNVTYYEVGLYADGSTTANSGTLLCRARIQFNKGAFTVWNVTWNLNIA